MKKIICSMVMLALTISIMGCSKKEKSNNSSNEITSESSQSSDNSMIDESDMDISQDSDSPVDSLQGASSSMNSSNQNTNIDTTKFGVSLLSLYQQNYISKNAASGLEGSKSISRKTLADICGKILGLKNAKLPSDISANDWYSQGVGTSQEFDLFGSMTGDFKFNTSEILTRLDAARLSIRLYAALSGIEDYQVDPGNPSGITDLNNISVEKQWFVYSALSKSFLKTRQTGKFEGLQNLTGNEAGEMLLAVINLVKSQGRPVRSATISEKNNNFKIFPSLSGGVSDSIDTINISSIGGRGQRLAATSLQGLVNRDGAKVFVNQGRDWIWMTNFYIKEGYTKSIGKDFNNDIYGLMTKYKKYIKGAVVFDTNKLFTINVANDIAAVEGRIIIDATMINDVKAAGITDIKDLTGKFANMYEAAKWSYENNWPFMRRDAISWTCYYTSTDYNRDYSTQMKIPSIWGPAPSEDSSASDTNSFIREQLSKLPSNIPILGFQYSVNPRGEQIGWNEYNGVKICGMYGKYTNVSDWAGNYSFHTMVPVSAVNRKFVSKNTSTPSFEKTKKYIAVTMIESGDAPGYIQYGLKQRQWDDARRGQVAFNISYGLANYDLLPGLTQYFFQSSKINDYFFGAISGLGYMYPLEGYGSYELFDDDGIIISDQDLIMKDYYTKTGIMLGRLGFTSAGLYSHPGAFWSKADYDLVKKYIAPNIPGLTSLIVDMGRVVDLTGKTTTVDITSTIPLFHCISFWPSTSLGNSYETANDSAAATFLADQIENNVNSGNFFHAMAYSWMYSARRIELAKLELDRRHPGVYEFVTIDQLERLYKANK